MSFLHRQILIPLAYVRSGQREILGYLENFTSSNSWDREKIGHYQMDHLRRIARHAYQTVPYYRRLFEKINFSPEDIRTPEDFRKIPVLTKKMIQQSLPDLISDRYRRDELVHDSTGGSTGIPLNFCYDQNFLKRKLAATLCHFGFSGYRPGDRLAVLWGIDDDIPDEKKWRRGQRAVFNTIYLNAFDLTAERFKDFCREIRAFKPKYLRGYAGCLYLFARHAQKDGFTFRPSAVISEAEQLTEDRRQLIETVFQTKVYDLYGSREFGTIASECREHRGYHINFQNYFVEIEPLKDDPARGHIIVTALHNYGMPFIRYNLEDVGTWAAGPVNCPCGRNSPRLGIGIGRTSDFFVARDGRIVHGEYFTHLFYHTRGIEKFQLVQQSVEHFQLKLVKTDEYREHDIDPFIGKIRERFGEDVAIDVIWAADISKEASGKYLFTKSNVALSSCI